MRIVIDSGCKAPYGRMLDPLERRAMAGAAVVC